MSYSGHYTCAAEPAHAALSDPACQALLRAERARLASPLEHRRHHCFIGGEVYARQVLRVRLSLHLGDGEAAERAFDAAVQTSEDDARIAPLAVMLMALGDGADADAAERALDPDGYVALSLWLAGQPNVRRARGFPRPVPRRQHPGAGAKESRERVSSG